LRDRSEKEAFRGGVDLGKPRSKLPALTFKQTVLRTLKWLAKKKLRCIFLEKLLFTMPTISRQSKVKPEAAAVLSKAVAHAAARLDIPQAMLAKVLGVSAPTISRLYSGEYLFTQGRKEWDFALLFVRVFRTLDSIVGDDSTARKWLASENLGLNGRPIELIRSIEGLVRVVQYLDASRDLV
jgi:uncharacterized protein (DUF2384 family)